MKNPLWSLFESTGSVEAYLLCKGITAEEDTDGSDR